MCEESVVVAHPFNHNTHEAHTGGSLGSRQLGLHRKFQDSQGYIQRERERERERFLNMIFKTTINPLQQKIFNKMGTC
jgi:hypothetical protein